MRCNPTRTVYEGSLSQPTALFLYKLLRSKFGTVLPSLVTCNFYLGESRFWWRRVLVVLEGWERLVEVELIPHLPTRAVYVEALFRCCIVVQGSECLYMQAVRAYFNQRFAWNYCNASVTEQLLRDSGVLYLWRFGACLQQQLPMYSARSKAFVRLLTSTFSWSKLRLKLCQAYLFTQICSVKYPFCA